MNMMTRIAKFSKATIPLVVLVLPMILSTKVAPTTAAGDQNMILMGINKPATFIQVTTTTDELNNDGDCSLREAVQASITNTTVDSCPAGAGKDTIVLPANTYTLSIGGNSEDANAEGDLDISGVLTISGAGSEATIIQAGTDTTNGIDRVLHVLSYGSLTIQGVQVRFGLAGYGAAPHIDGGGIYVAEYARLNVSNSTITNNWGANGGGITCAPGSIVNIDNSIISNNFSLSVGGGLKTQGTVSIRDTTFQGNTGIFGGAIGAYGILYIMNSTFYANNAIEFEGIPGEGGEGGAIYNYGEFNMSNSTVSGNSAINAGGGVHNSGTMHINNSTVTDNQSQTGGGLLGYNGTVVIANSIISANSGGNCNGAIISNNYNIDSDSTCNLIQANDQPNIDPKIDVIANNGGPTQTHALLFGSPAVDAGNPALPGSGNGACESEDQRGIPRPKGIACDIGAYEEARVFIWFPVIFVGE